MSETSLHISALRSLHLVEGLRCLLVVIEWRQQSGLHPRAQLLHLGGVKTEVLAREGAHANELEVATYDIPYHRQLVNP